MGNITKLNIYQKLKKLTGYSFSYSENDFITKFIFKNSSTHWEFYTYFNKCKGCEAKAYFKKKKYISRI